MVKSIIATFHPQAWINDYATDVDPQGPTEYDVSSILGKLDETEARTYKDNGDKSDTLKNAANAPQWVKDWSGPFWIEVEAEIDRYFTSHV